MIPTAPAQPVLHSSVIKLPAHHHGTSAGPASSGVQPRLKHAAQLLAPAFPPHPAVRPISSQLHLTRRRSSVLARGAATEYAAEARSGARQQDPPARKYRFLRQDGGSLCAEIERLPDRSCRVVVSATRLPEKEPCFLHWGLYRASPGKWLHPEDAVPENSTFRHDLAAMHTEFSPPGSEERTVSFRLPASSLPLSLACTVYVGGERPRFLKPRRGLHCCVPVGMAAGIPTPLGGTILPAGHTGASPDAPFSANFAVVSRNARALFLRILRLDEDDNVTKSMEIALDGKTNRTGDTWHVQLDNLKGPERLAFAWRAEGDKGWQQGLRFLPGALLLDPYAAAAVRVKLPEAEHGAALRPPTDTFAWPARQHPRTPLDESVWLEVDTERYTAAGSLPEHRGKWRGVLDKLPELQELGVTGIVLSCPMLRGPGFGVQGEAHVSYFAPDPRFAVGHGARAVEAELKELVAGLHACGIEVMIQVEFSFTTEGGDDNPAIIGMRGLDAALYYRSNGLLNLAHPVMRRLVVDSLAHWATTYHVDGFVLLSAESMTQAQDGAVLDCPPLVQAIAAAPQLRGTRVVAYPRDDGLLPRGGRRGFPHGAALLQHNGRFQTDVLAWLAAADPGMLTRIAMRLTGSADVFEADWKAEPPLPGNLAAGRRPAMAVNSTPSPIVSSQTLQQWADAACAGNDVRMRVTICKTALLMVMLAQGTPLLAAADVDSGELRRFFKAMRQFRGRHAALMQPPLFDSPRNLSWHGVHGGEPAWGGGAGPADAVLAFMVQSPGGAGVYVGVNPGWESVRMIVPAPPPGAKWGVRINSGAEMPEDVVAGGSVLDGNEVWVGPKAAVCLEAVPYAAAATTGGGSTMSAV